MITSIAKPKIQIKYMGYSASSGQCACYEYSIGGTTGAYYVKTYNDSDIRCITGIFTDTLGETPASSGYYAMQLTTGQALGNGTGLAALSGSRYHYIYWDGKSLSSESWGTATEAVQVTEGSKLGLFYTTSSWASTCSLTYSGYWLPNGSTWTGLNYYLWTDRFGCNTAPTGYYIEPQTYVRKYWNGSTFTPKSAWNPASPPHIDLQFGTSANAAVCNSTLTVIRQHCGGSNPVIDWQYPIMDDNNPSNFAATGYYTENGSGSGSWSHYWNGTIGVWGATTYQQCMIK
jgi:hypothetical protein